MYARPFIDSLDFARNGREISGEVAITEMSRLQDMLENPQGILSYTVRGGVDDRGSHYLDINVTGRCSLICQRCLEGLDYPVKLDTRLLLRDQAGLDAMDDDEDEFDSILADAHLDVLNMLEEEILLSLPIAPRHEAGACNATSSESRQENVRRPFEVLAKLKRN